MWSLLGGVVAKAMCDTIQQTPIRVESLQVADEREVPVTVEISAQTFALPVGDLLRGDLSSLAGIWVNSRGHQVEISQEKTPLRAVQHVSKGVLQASLGSQLCYILPAGQNLSLKLPGTHQCLQDRSDKTRNRLYLGQSAVYLEDEENFYYRLQ